MSDLPVVDITFGSEYSYNSDSFQQYLKDSLEREGFLLGKLKYARHGQGDSLFIGDELITDQSHPIHNAINRAEEWVKEDEVD